MSRSLCGLLQEPESPADAQPLQRELAPSQTVDEVLGVPPPREDHELFGTATLARELGEKITVSLLLQHTRNHSNFDIYDYDRNLVMLNTHVKF